MPAGVPWWPLGDSDKVEVGGDVFIVGAPYGISHTLTAGHVSGRHRPNTIYSELATAEFVQTDAAINEGNSGGPMFGMAGEVIGIVSHIISKSGGFEGLGFVVTSNMARALLLERRSFCDARRMRSWLLVAAPTRPDAAAKASWTTDAAADRRDPPRRAGAAA